MKQEIIDMVSQALAGKIPMFVLRGVDAYARTGGDIDILMPSSKPLVACQLIANLAKDFGWYVCGFKDIGYVVSLTLIRPKNSDLDDVIKLDLISGLEWYGVGAGKVTDKFFYLFDRALSEGKSLDHLSAFATFYQKLMAAGRLNEREWSRVFNDVKELKVIVDIAEAVGINLELKDINEKGVGAFRKWRIRAESAGVCGVMGLTFWFPRAALAHLKFKLGVGTHWGHKIGLSGLDGSGKSTQMERLFAAYRKAGGEQPLLVHLLPEWIPMPHQLLRRKKTEQNYTRPYAEAPVQSMWSGLLRLCYYLLAFSATKCWMSGKAMRGQVIVLDRSFLDFAADLTRSRIPDFRLPGWLIRLCAPRGTLLFLDALPATVVRRKGELQLDKATDLRRRYLSVFKLVNGTVIDAEGTPDIVFTHILDQIDVVYRARLAAAVLE